MYPIAFFIFVSEIYADCTSNIRKEWRELTTAQQQAYVDAVNCLRKSKSKLHPDINSPHRYGDMAYSHLTVMANAHGTPNFFPWHRAFLWEYERILQTECGYVGNLPYWDWSLESQDAASSILLTDSIPAGFGKFNPDQNNCVTGGSFANLQCAFGGCGCLSRDTARLNGYYGWYSSDALNFQKLNSKSFDSFRSSIETGSHGIVHVSLGGSMLNQNQASNDPLFFLHHCMVDKLWWDWQQLYPEKAMVYTNDEGTTVLESSRKEYLYGMRSGSDRTWNAGQMLNTISNDPLCYVYSAGVKLSKNTLSKRDLDTSNNSNKLKCPLPLDEAWAKRMGITDEKLQEIRAKEAELCDFIQLLNKDDNYVAPECEIAQTRTNQRIWTPKTAEDDLKQFKNVLKKVTAFMKNWNIRTQ